MDDLARNKQMQKPFAERQIKKTAFLKKMFPYTLFIHFILYIVLDKLHKKEFYILKLTDFGADPGVSVCLCSCGIIWITYIGVKSALLLI